MRITELQSVIAELTRKLNKVNGNKIIEEEEDIDEEHEGEEHDDDDARSHSTSDLEVQGKSNFILYLGRSFWYWICSFVFAVYFLYKVGSFSQFPSFDFVSRVDI